jgi:hypothetical protein
MKKLIFFPLLLLITTTKAQLNDTTKYLITEARINSEDCSQHYYEGGQFLIFYENENNERCFLNSKKNKEEYSFGKVYGLKSEKIEIENCPAENISFRWNYHNSYDDDSGYALVHLRRIYRENGVEFSIKILSKKLDIIEFSGFTSENVLKLKEEEENKFKNPGYLNTTFL